MTMTLAAAKTVLLTAATPWEARPLARALRLSPADAGRWTGRVGGRSLTLVQSGIGERRTSERLSALDRGAFELVVSAGLCGSLRGDVHAGDIVADARELELELVTTLRETAKTLGVPFHFGRILHTDVVLQSAVKRRLGEERRAVACDMETAAVRRWTAGGGPATLAVRAVLDEADEDLPADAPDGEDAAAMARFALRRPLELPRLVRTGWRCARAMASLGRLLNAYLEALP